MTAGIYALVSPELLTYWDPTKTKTANESSLTSAGVAPGLNGAGTTNYQQMGGGVAHGSL